MIIISYQVEVIQFRGVVAAIDHAHVLADAGEAGDDDIVELDALVLQTRGALLVCDDDENRKKRAVYLNFSNLFRQIKFFIFPPVDFQAAAAYPARSQIACSSWA